MASGVLEPAIVGWLKRIWLRLGGGSSDPDVGTIVSISDGAGGTVTSFGGPEAVVVAATLDVGTTTSASVETLGRTLLSLSAVMNTGTATIIVQESDDSTNWFTIPVFNVTTSTQSPQTSISASTASTMFSARLTGRYVRFSSSGIAGSEVVTIAGFLSSGNAPYGGEDIQSWGGADLTGASGTGDSFSSSANGATVNSREMLFDGANYNQSRNNVNTSLLASAARTVTTNSADQTNFNGRGVKVVLNVSVIGTGDITLTIQGKDSISGNYYTLLAGANVITNSTNIYTVYPGVAVAANVSASDIVPRTWRISVTANNANSVTYSVSSTTVL